MKEAWALEVILVINLGLAHWVMQNAKGAQRDNGATPTRLTLKKTLGHSVIHSMPGAQSRAPNLADYPPTDLRCANLTTAHR